MDGRRRVPPTGRFAMLFGGIWFVVGGALAVAGAAAWRADPAQNAEVGLGLAAVGSFFAIAGAIIFGVGLRQRVRAARLLANGVPVDGTVTEVKATAAKLNNVTQWRVRYRYRDYGGTEHEGRSALLDPATAKQYSVGQSVQVLYDREHPKTSLLPDGG